MSNTLTAATLALGLSAGPSLGCAMAAETDFRDIFLADAIVVGDIMHYEIVDPDPDPERGPLLNYARFDVRVREVIPTRRLETVAPPTRTNPGKRPIKLGTPITVTWDNSTFGEPDDLKSDGRRGFLIALRDPSSALPPLRAGSAFIAPTPEPEHYTVLQAPCASAFIFEMDSLIAIALRQLLTTERDKDIEWAVLSEFLFDNGANSMVERKLMERRYTAP